MMKPSTKKALIISAIVLVLLIATAIVLALVNNARDKKAKESAAIAPEQRSDAGASLAIGGSNTSAAGTTSYVVSDAGNIVQQTANTIAFDPRPYSEALKRELIDTSYLWSGASAGNRCKAMKDAAILSDAQLRLVKNDFIQLTGTTIQKAIEGTWVAGCIGWDAEWDEVLTDKLNKLQ